VQYLENDGPNRTPGICKTRLGYHVCRPGPRLGSNKDILYGFVLYKKYGKKN